MFVSSIGKRVLDLAAAAAPGAKDKESITLRRHAKASSAGSTKATGNSRGPIRRAFATRAASSDFKGTGARLNGRLAGFLAVIGLAVSVLSLTVAPALAAPPTVETNSATASYTSAEVTGTIDPADNETGYYFEYSSDPAVEGWNNTSNKYGPRTVPAGSGPTTVSEQIPFGPCELDHCDVPLKAGTTYVYRLVAINAEGEFTSPAPYDEFTTLPVTAPTILSANDATNITNHSALITGQVERGSEPSDPATNPKCRVEYISDEAYGDRNESQRVTIAATGGTYTLNFYDPYVRTSVPIAFDASAAAVQSALEGLGNIGPGNVEVTSPEAGVYDVGFVSALAARNLNQMFIDPSSLVEPTLTEVTTTAEGHEAFEGGGSSVCSPHPLTTPGTTSVTSAITGLQPNTVYHARLTVSNAGGSDSQEIANFRTKAVPLVQTLGAGELEGTSATLSGRINPENSPVTYQFEWGAQEGEGDTTYEQVAPADPEPLGASDTTFHSAKVAIDGLSPGSHYHYRIVAFDAHGDPAFGVDRSFVTPVAAPPSACPNESSRVGPSAGLPDCRALELATPDINGISTVSSAAVLADGSAIKFLTADVPLNAEGGAVQSWNISRRGADGWSTRSLAPPIRDPEELFQEMADEQPLVSSDYTEWVFETGQQLAPGAAREELNYYLHRANGEIVLLTTAGTKPIVGESQYPHFYESAGRASGDFKHLLLRPVAPQHPGDPEVSGNYYDWHDGQLRLVGILPSVGGEPEQPAPSGAWVPKGVLPSLSYDGEQILFFEADGSQLGGPASGLYLREHGQVTVEVSASQRSPEDPNGPAIPQAVGITADGSKVLFISKSELTDDANTGRAEGVSSDSGADLYSYDVASKVLTDLTVDEEPEDVQTGANVQEVVGATQDASYIYFVATGNLADGALSGDRNLYVEHEGEITFVAPAQGLHSAYVTPDGLKAVIQSTESLTGYDNAGQAEVYKYVYGGALECASCRVDGMPAVKGAGIAGRAISDDGTRLFFQSSDEVVPGADNGLARIYEYSDGKAELLSPRNSSVPARLLDASASGDDVFFASYEGLTPGDGSTFSIYDARVNADTFKPTRPECQGEGCRGAGSSAPGSSSAGSAKFEAPGEVTAPKSKAARSKALKLRINVPDAGLVTVSGKGIQTAKRNAAKAGPVTLTVILKPAANKRRLRKGVFKTKARVLFKPQAGSQFPARGAKRMVTLRFEGPKKKGGK